MKRFICIAAAAVVALSAQFATAAVTQNQWVRADQDGSVKGRVVVPRSEGISALRDGVVSLVDERGKFVAREVKSDQTGRFSLNGVKPGVYTLMINGKDAFACCAMHVVSSNVAIQDEFVVAAGAIDYDVVRSAAMRYLPVSGRSESSSVSFDPSMNPMTTDRALSKDWFHIRRSEGGLKGRLSRAGFAEEMAAPQANVLIFRDGVEVARTLSGKAGEFYVPNLPTGSYSVLASGEHGLGVVGLKLVDDLGTAKTDSEDASRLVQQFGDASDEFVMQVAPLPGAGQVIEDRVIDEQIVDLGIVDDGGVIQGGAVSGPIGGGPAGGGGVGGRRRGLAVGFGIAALVVALADDDDDTSLTPIASPATP